MQGIILCSTRKRILANSFASVKYPHTFTEPEMPNLTPNPLSYILNFPTPKVQDQRVVESYSIKSGKYPLEIGSPHPNKRLFPDHRLTKQSPADGAGETATLVYATDQHKPDEWNYGIKYSGDAPAYPIFFRTYLKPRDGFKPEDVLTTLDPIFKSESTNPVILVEQELRASEDEEVSSLYVTVLMVYETVPGPQILSKKLVDSPVGLVNATETRQRVDYGETVAGGFGTLSTAVESESTTKAEKVTVTVDGGVYPELVSYDYDGQLNAVIETTRTVVPAGTPYTKAEGDLEQRDSPIDQWKTLRIISHVNPEDLLDREEFKTVDYTFPSILESCSVDILTYGANDTETVRVKPVLRAAASTATKIRTVTSFHTSQPADDAVYQIVPNDLVYRGVSFSVSFNNVLNDTFTLEASGFASDQYIGLVDDVEFGESFPSATDYIALIGTEVIIGCDIQFYRGGIWIKRVSRIVLL